MYIYHFTKLSNLLKILKSRRLFFGDLKYANDPSEGIYATEIIENCLRSICSNKDEFNNIICFFNINTSLNESLNVYSISFASNNSNIHMWMEYGDHARGVAIAFDLELLSKILEEQTDNYLSLRKVEYNENNVKKWIEKIYHQNKATNNFMEMENQILALYPYIKHKSYKTEREFRVSFVSSEPDTSASSDDMLFGWDCGNGRYYLNINKLIRSNVIKMIYLGSNVTLFEKKTLQDTLKKYGFDIHIRTKFIQLTTKEK